MSFLTSIRNHQRWFLVACMVVGGAVATLPFLSEPNGNLAVAPYLTTVVGCGFVAGFLQPERPWRWGVAMAIGQPIAGITFHPEMALVSLVTVPLIPLVATPSIIGAYLGRFVAPGKSAIPIVPIISRPAAISSRLVVLSGAGLLACAIPVFFVRQTSSALPFIWVGVAVAVAITSVAWARSGILQGTGIAIGVAIGGFITAVGYDTATGGSHHNLLPFEMLYVMVVTAVPAGLLALFTQWVVARLPTSQLSETR
jgi:hypothetical protein